MRRLQLLLIDVLLLALATVAALYLRDNFELDPDRLANLLPYLAASVVVAIPIFAVLGLNRSVWHYSAMVDYLRIAIAVVSAAFAATVIVFVYNRMDNVARSLPVLQAVLGACTLIGARVAVRLWFAERPVVRPFATDVPVAGENVLLIGLTSLTELYIKSLDELGRERQSIAGIIDYSARHGGDRVHLYRLFGPDAALHEVIEELAVHGVFVDRIVVTTTLAKLAPRARQDILDFGKVSAIPVEYLAERMGFGKRDLPEAAPVEELKPAPTPTTLTFKFSDAEVAAIARRRYWILKRAIDAVMAAVLLALLWPLMIAVAVVIAADLGHPALFWQQRPGVGGQAFRLFKFRTMHGTRGRDGRLLLGAERLGRVGRLLRKTRLDELPQIWNILIGEMSFVGPRPLLPIDQSAAYAARLMVRPGLTGWAQVLGGRDVQPADKAALDVWYVKHASLRLDLEILVRTIPVILFGEKISREAIQSAWDDLRRTGVCTSESADEAVTGGTTPPTAALDRGHTV